MALLAWLRLAKAMEKHLALTHAVYRYSVNYYSHQKCSLLQAQKGRRRHVLEKASERLPFDRALD